MFWVFLIASLLGLALYSAWKFGLFEKFSMQKGRLMACEILYLPYKGDYQKIGPLFEQVTRNTQTVFKFSQSFGFYFDDLAVESPQNCRAIVGILVNQGEQFKIKEFCANNPGYKRAHIKTTRHISYEMPYVNVLSILLMVKTVYPKINEYMKKEEINEGQLCGMMEVYKCVGSEKRIQVIVPLNNREQFLALIQDKDEQKLVQQQPKMNI